jgi:hypothetical protein
MTDAPGKKKPWLVKCEKSEKLHSKTEKSQYKSEKSQPKNEKSHAKSEKNQVKYYFSTQLT